MNKRDLHPVIVYGNTYDELNFHNQITNSNDDFFVYA